MRKNVGRVVGGLVVAAIFVLIGIVVALQFVLRTPEVYMGLVSGLVIGAIMVLLFIIAAGFRYLGLADAQQALGLPEGSIRAMIALFLIMIFIFFGLYLFRSVADFSGMTLHNLSGDQVKELGDKVVAQYQTGDNQYDVVIRMALDSNAVDMAKQLINTIGTLVVAVAGFYFGSRAVQAARGGAVSAEPEIRSIKPEEAEEGSTIAVTINGENFVMPKTVLLKKGKTEIKADEIMSNATQITCKFNLKDAPADEKDKYDLSIANEDGGEGQLSAAFKVTPKATKPAEKPITKSAARPRPTGRTAVQPR
ncbi:MAG: hypothetical protein HY258_12385 [Chloroflexi bacterium]|nr:hypothetical protein [Chloroflexota bacterium]